MERPETKLIVDLMLSDIRQSNTRIALAAMLGTVSDWNVACVGVSMQGLHAMTFEAVAYIASADVVFCYPSTGAHLNLLKLLNPNVSNMHETHYVKGRSFEPTYAEIIDHVLGIIRSGKRVTYATQGSPAFHCGTAVAIHQRAKKEGYISRLIPGVSSFELISTQLSEQYDLKSIQLYTVPDVAGGLVRIDPNAPVLLFDLGRYVLPAVRETVADLKTDRLAELGTLLRSVYRDDHPISLILILPDGKTQLETVDLKCFEEAIQSFSALPTLFLGRL